MAGRISAATERAIRRVQHGGLITTSARAEGIDPSTLFRALGRRRDRNDGALGRIVLVGAGNLGRELRQWITMDRSEPIVFLDDFSAGAHIIGTVDSYERRDGDEVLIAIADPKQKAAAAERFAKLATFVSSEATVGQCEMAEGALLLPGSIVTTNVTIGKVCVLNLHATLGHDVILGDYCTLSPHVGISGWVTIGARCFFGTGASVIPHINIGDDCTIGAGAVVIKDVPSGATMVGNPARRIK